jgi:hypothetical protein
MRDLPKWLLGLFEALVELQRCTLAKVICARLKCQSNFESTLKVTSKYGLLGLTPR